ncbi:AMP-binding protein [Mycobacterium sp. CPCC 205372]|uniref:AMP-binding protein n=1 Tax=Mycobacterium hippophais TaxID=3016340 RepID=A0ABT4PXP4_9MYCO|nr:AMP-binding protein [Mycobacterium hippophais]MCZ8381283.1 AMP-binding protein [Mycobacterium hippophais]
MSEAPMVRCGTVERTHDELTQRVARVAAGLAAIGVSAGDNVALVMANSVEFLEVSAGIAAAGASPVPVNWHWKSDEIGYLLDNSGSAVVFAHADYVCAVEQAAPIGVDVIEIGTDSSAASGRHREYEEWLAESEPVSDSAAVSAGLGTIYTSGTTGRPKGIVREPVSAESMMAMAMTMMTRMGLAPGGRTMIPAPMYHTAPNTMATFAVRLMMDTTILARFDPEEFLAAVERHRIEQVQMVPTMFTRLLRLPVDVRNSYDLSSLRSVVHSAAPCPKHVKQQMIDWLGPIITEYYGGSETGPIVWCTAEEWLAHPGTVGAPTDGAAVRIVRDDGTEAAVGEVGMVYVKPADYWPGFTYLGDDEKRRNMELDGFVTVGDMGLLNEDGYLFLTDRSSDMVISGGVNIYPAETEAALSELPGVRDCAVFGVPDEEYGESLAAHIETDRAAGLTEDDVRSFLRSRLAGYKVPKLIVFDDALPREESGKLFKRIIRESYWQGSDNKI